MSIGEDEGLIGLGKTTGVLSVNDRARQITQKSCRLDL